MTIRCKFNCQGVTKRMSSRWNAETQKQESCFVYDAEMFAVVSGSDENKQFFASTPGGEFRVKTISHDRFEPGKSYYLDITPAE